MGNLCFRPRGADGPDGESPPAAAPGPDVSSTAAPGAGPVESTTTAAPPDGGGSPAPSSPNPSSGANNDNDGGFKNYYFYDVDALRTLGETWTWEKKSWKVGEVRRTTTPLVYERLRAAVEKGTGPAEQQAAVPMILGGTTRTSGGGSIQTEDQTVVSDTKIFNNAQFAISGGVSSHKGHQIPKSPTCRPFYGPLAERAVGCSIQKKDQKLGWSILLHGKKKDGSEIKDNAVYGIEKMAENFLMMNEPHANIYDNLSTGVVATIPIIDLSDAISWQQGTSYDLLLIADSARTYKLLTPQEQGGVVQFATSDDVDKATAFLSSCILELGGILAGDDNTFLEGMADDLDEENDNEEAAKLVNQRILMRGHLQKLDDLRNKLREQGGIDVPCSQGDSTKRILKVNMQAYMEKAEISTYENTNLYPFADPVLVGFKAAINVYYQKTDDKLFPACHPPVSDDSSDDESSDWFWRRRDEEPPEDESAGLPRRLHAPPAASDLWVPTEVVIVGGDIPIVSDDEESLGE